MNAEQIIESLKLQVTTEQRAAILELESRGFHFCIHFGYENAEEVLENMNRASETGCLYEWLDGFMGANYR